jgi:CRISPR-associated Csx2 family protein
MSKLFLSLLGTNDYLECIYEKGAKSAKSRFIQEAILNLYASDWSGEDRILILTTEEAYARNWLDNGQKVKGETVERRGLKSCIESLGLPIMLSQVDIPLGRSEKELWEIFDIVFNCINPEDEVLLDVTHALRSLPILALVVLNYAKVCKNISLDKLLYGAFEVLGDVAKISSLTVEERNVPIFDITPFDEILQWSFGIDRFIKGGDATLIRSLADKATAPLLRACCGADEHAKLIKKFGRTLEEFACSLSTCRSSKISPLASELNKQVTGCEGQGHLKPLSPLLVRLKDSLGCFGESEIRDGLYAAKWCSEHNLIQQGYTILQETLVSFFISSIENDVHDRKVRTIANQAVKIYREKFDQERWLQPAKDDPELVRSFLEIFKEFPQLIEAYNNISNFRNDLNHAGCGRNPTSTHKFYKELRTFINLALEYVK